MDQEKIKELYDIFATIDEHYFPNGNEWIAGENLTIADFAYVSTVAGLVVSLLFKFSLGC
jgi:glutathione S-transferase